MHTKIKFCLLIGQIDKFRLLPKFHLLDIVEKKIEKFRSVLQDIRYLESVINISIR